MSDKLEARVESGNCLSCMEHVEEIGAEQAMAAGGEVIGPFCDIDCQFAYLLETDTEEGET